jgi:hypothetical protein
MPLSDQGLSGELPSHAQGYGFDKEEPVLPLYLVTGFRKRYSPAALDEIMAVIGEKLGGEAIAILHKFAQRVNKLPLDEQKHQWLSTLRTLGASGVAKSLEHVRNLAQGTEAQVAQKTKKEKRAYTCRDSSIEALNTYRPQAQARAIATIKLNAEARRLEREAANPPPIGHIQAVVLQQQVDAAALDQLAEAARARLQSAQAAPRPDPATLIIDDAAVQILDPVAAARARAQQFNDPALKAQQEAANKAAFFIAENEPLPEPIEKTVIRPKIRLHGRAKRPAPPS